MIKIWFGIFILNACTLNTKFYYTYFVREVLRKVAVSTFYLRTTCIRRAEFKSKSSTLIDVLTTKLSVIVP